MRNIGDDLTQDHNLHLKTTLMSGHCEKIILKLTKVRSLSQLRKLILESVYMKEQKIKQISNQMISSNTEFEVIDKINPQKITFHSRTNRGIQLKSFNK